MDYTQFEVKSPYPRKTEYTRTFYYKAGKVVAISHPTGLLPLLAPFIDGSTLQETGVEVLAPGVDPYSKNKSDPTSLLNFVSDYEFDEGEFNKAKEAYAAKIALARQRFIDHFEQELGIVDHPKARTFFAKCWDLGHSAGYSEVMTYGYDLVELIK